MTNPATPRTATEHATAALDEACAAHDRGDTWAAREAAKHAAGWAWQATINRQAAENMAAREDDLEKWAQVLGYHIGAERRAWRDADAARTAARETQPSKGV